MSNRRTADGDPANHISPVLAGFAIAAGLALLAILEARVDSDLALTGFLVIGPLLAAGLTGPRTTAAVGGFATLLAVGVLGEAEARGSARHVTGAVLVAAVAALAVWLAGLRVRRERERTLLNGLLSATPVGFAYLDRDLRYRWVNESLAAMNGLPASEHVGKTPLELLPDIPADNYLPLFRAALDSGEAVTGVEITGGTAAEPTEVRHWEENFYPLRHSDGEIVGLGVVAVEVTERRQAEHEVRAQEATLRLILDSAPSGMLLVDREGRILAVNQEAERLFAYEPGELTGRQVDVLVPEPVQARHPQHRRSFDQDPRTRMMGHGRDLSARRKDGSEFPVEVGLAVAASAPGLVTCVVTDISERKRVEQARVAVLEEERAARERLNRLHRVTEAALGHLSVEDLLPELLSRVMEAVQADTATVLLLDEDSTSLVVTASVGWEDEAAVSGTVPVGSGVAGRVAETGQAVLIPDLSAADVHRQALRDRGLHSLLAVPLVVLGSVIGVLHVGAQQRSHFTEDDLALLQLVADRVALAVDRARAFEREHEIAETLQRSLLPERLPALEAARVAVRYRPGATGTSVGGDWYDLIALDDGTVICVIGDVMGHGVRAAAVMGQLRNAVRVYVGLALPLPALVARLNELVLGMGDAEMATVLVVAIRPRIGQLSWVSAGHVPALVRDADGGVRFLDHDDQGIALGVTGEAEYAECTAVLPSGAMLLLYTDGLVERAGDSLDNGLARLLEVMRGAPSDPDDCCDLVLSTLLGEEQARDDVAVVALAVEPTQRPTLRLAVAAGPEGLGHVRRELRQWLHGVGASAEEEEDLLLVVGEAISARLQQGDGQGGCYLAVELVEDRVEVVLRGTADWRPPEGTDHGRGLVLMEAVVNELAIHRDGDGNEIRLMRRLAGGGPAR